jgi:hypothetical protein
MLDAWKGMSRVSNLRRLNHSCLISSETKVKTLGCIQATTRILGNLIEKFPRQYMEIRKAHLANSEAIFTLKAKCDSQQVCGFCKMDSS